MNKTWKLVLLFLLSMAVGAASAQVTVVSGTVTDSDNTTWFNAQITVTFVPNPSYPQANQYNVNGQSLTNSTYSQYLQQTVSTGTGANSGKFTIPLIDNTKIAPSGSSWKIVICSYTSAPCSTFPNLAVQGSTQDITGFITTNITAPRFPAGSSITGAAYGYAQAEVSPIPVPGGSFFNVSTGLTNVWGGTGVGWNVQAIGNFCGIVGCDMSGTLNVPLIDTTSFGGEVATTVLLTSYINGVIQADLFCGAGKPSCSADMCTKVQAAELYAIANGIPQVDATHFTGTQVCTSNVDMFGNLTTAQNPVNLTVNFGVVHVVFKAVAPTITNSAFTIHGMGIMQTVFECAIPAVQSACLYAHAQLSSVGFTNGLTEVNLSDFFVYGDTINGTVTLDDAILLVDVNRSKINNLGAWGTSGCGIHTMGDDSTSMYDMKVSGVEAAALNLGNSSLYQTPTGGLCLDKSPYSGNFTQANTIVNPAAEGVLDDGFHLINAQLNVFYGGTSESNGNGITEEPGVFNKFNTFINTDLEGNTPNVRGSDINDLGQANTYINVLATSTCTSCNSVYLAGNGGQLILNGDYPTGFTGGGLNGSIPGQAGSTATSGAATLPGQPAGFKIEYLNGNLIKIPYYNN